MDFNKQCSIKLEECNKGQVYNDDIYFSLKDLEELPGILWTIDEIESSFITPYCIGFNSIIEICWCELVLETVTSVGDKFADLLSEAGKSSLEEIEMKYIDQWDNTHFQVLKDDKKSFIESLERYISYMKTKESSLLKELNEDHHLGNQILFKI